MYLSLLDAKPLPKPIMAQFTDAYMFFSMAEEGFG